MEENIPLIKMSKSDWHYKLNRYIFGKKIIDTTMNNLCPYFWLLIAAMLIVPFAGILDLVFRQPFRLILNGIDAHLDRQLARWGEKLSPDDMATIFRDGDGYMYGSNGIKIPSKISDMSDTARYEIVKRWAMNELKLDIETKSGKKEWTKFLKERRAERDRRIERTHMRNREKAEYSRLREAKLKARQKQITDALNMVAIPFEYAFKAMRKAFTFKINKVSTIIKTTKKVVGAIITVGLAYVFYYVVQYLVYLFMMGVKYWNGAIFVTGAKYTGMGIVALLVLAIVGYVLFKMAKSIAATINRIQRNYESGEKKYFLIDFIVGFAKYVVYLPLKYLVWYPIYYPLYFVFYSVLWKTIAIAIVWNSLTSFWRGLMSVSGIFGEYFGRSKGDYCPGMDWSE